MYHIEGMSLEPDSEPYHLKQPDQMSASLEEIMGKLQLADGITFESYRIDQDGNAILKLARGKSVSEENLLLTKAEIVRSLEGIEGLQDIELDIGEDTATYTDSSFFYYDDAEDSAVNTGDVILYLPDGKGSLKKVKANVTIGAETSAQEAVLSQLSAYDVLPEGTKVRQVSVMNGTATVDFSREFVTGESSNSPEIIIKCVVNSLTSLPNISKVQILSEGKKIDVYRNAVETGGPLSFMESEE